jgi:cellulose synthase/poly-beta-1,6-N-acetylglucosamine synthase-like glycosyltransferase
MVYRNAENTTSGDGCGAYMRYENWLRQAETNVGSVVGVDGGVDAIRRRLYRPMRPEELSDMVLPLSVVEAGYRVVYEPAAVVHELALGTVADEFRMRVRVSLRALWTLVEMRHLLNPLAFPTFAWQLASHKVLRYVVPVLCLSCFVASLFLSQSGGAYRLYFLAQCSLVVAAVVGLGAEWVGRPVPMLSMPSYFLLVNAAALRAILKLLNRERYTTWQPRLD